MAYFASSLVLNLYGSHLHFTDVDIKCYTFNKSSDDFIMNIQ
ncbi:hypothetical protein [Rickettsia endosymbiont of Cantharis rufa]